MEDRAAYLMSPEHRPRPEPDDRIPLVLAIGEVCAAAMRVDALLVGLEDHGAEPVGVPDHTGGIQGHAGRAGRPRWESS